jgi:dipeptidase D
MSVSVFEKLEPALVWKHFEALTSIRRPSGEEEQAQEYVRNWAKEHGFALEEDATGNLVVKVPASAGKENAPVVIIQGHLDMVCERNSDSPYDSFAGNLHLLREDDWIKADGTTLGADNGIGCCAGMAAAEDPAVEHGPLELLYTIDEETGMTGARGLSTEMLSGKLMLNLDSEDDDLIFVGCSGGKDTLYKMPLTREKVPQGHVARKLSIGGLTGGHSGLDINRNRLNAIKALVQILDECSKSATFELLHIEGGKMRNAIPREGHAIIGLDSTEEDALRKAVEKAATELRAQYEGLEPGFSVQLEENDEDVLQQGAFPRQMKERLLSFLMAVPSGVVAMSQDIEGLVETSTNLGVLKTGENTVEAVSCSRSSVAPALKTVLARLAAIAKLAQVETEEVGGYPGWKPNMDSLALKTVKKSYQKLFGEAPQVTAIHAGLECGLIGEHLPGIDMVSFGPSIRGAHSPDERVSIASVQKFYRLLSEVLKELAKR